MRDALVEARLPMTDKPHKLNKKTSLTIGIVLMLAASAFLVAGAAASGQGLAPLLRGDRAAFERSLSRDTATLGLKVAEVNEEGKPQPVEGATIVLVRAGRDASPDAVATGTTDADGRALFELKRGLYRIVVSTPDGKSADREVPLGKDVRLGLIFFGEGESKWVMQDRKHIERHDGEKYALTVRVGRAEGDRHAPISGAMVVIYKPTDKDSPRDGEPVDRASTNDRGVAVFQLPSGKYGVKVKTADNLTAATGVLLKGDQGVAIFFDSNGEAHVRSGDAPRGQRDEAVHLGVGVFSGTREDGKPAQVVGANVVVYKVEGDQRRAVARGVTDDRGFALFTLAPGAYFVKAEKDGKSAEKGVRLQEDQKLMLQLT
jgi:5-hydroxyisourate hydrolase-like protein (transthyretin family)